MFNGPTYKNSKKLRFNIGSTLVMLKNFKKFFKVFLIFIFYFKINFWNFLYRPRKFRLFLFFSQVHHKHEPQEQRSIPPPFALRRRPTLREENAPDCGEWGDGGSCFSPGMASIGRQRRQRSSSRSARRACSRLGRCQIRVNRKNAHENAILIEKKRFCPSFKCAQPLNSWS